MLSLNPNDFICPTQTQHRKKNHENTSSSQLEKAMYVSSVCTVKWRPHYDKMTQETSDPHKSNNAQLSSSSKKDPQKIRSVCMAQRKGTNSFAQKKPGARWEQRQLVSAAAPPLTVGSLNLDTGHHPSPAAHTHTHTDEMGRWVGTVWDETAAFTALPIKVFYHISCNATH